MESHFPFVFSRHQVYLGVAEEIHSWNWILLRGKRWRHLQKRRMVEFRPIGMLFK